MSKIGEQILEMDDLPSKTVFVPMWNTKLIVKSIPVGMRARLEREAAGRQPEDIMVSWVIASTYDVNNERAFDDSHAERLLGKSSPAVLCLWEELAKLNRIRKEDVEELAKN